MGFGTSLFLLAVGAILTFAVEVDVQGFNLDAVGVILMIVGGIGLIASIIYWNSWGGFGSAARRRRVIEEDL
jgi:sulfite exporter TauE/SafE